MCNEKIIPNEYTACECYRGFTIAIRNSIFHIFTEFKGTAFKFENTFETRKGAREAIDKFVAD